MLHGFTEDVVEHAPNFTQNLSLFQEVIRRFTEFSDFLLTNYWAPRLIHILLRIATVEQHFQLLFVCNKAILRGALLIVCALYLFKIFVQNICAKYLFTL
jgi:hypothetical protein